MGRVILVSLTLLFIFGSFLFLCLVLAVRWMYTFHCSTQFPVTNRHSTCVALLGHDWPFVTLSWRIRIGLQLFEPESRPPSCALLTKPFPSWILFYAVFLRQLQTIFFLIPSSCLPRPKGLVSKWRWNEISWGRDRRKEGKVVLSDSGESFCAA